MNLRPHHILCVQKFTGHGYDRDFTAHMTALVRELSESPATPVTLADGCDDLCARCPHNDSGRCRSLEKVERMDGAVLHHAGLAAGGTYPWETLRQAGRRLLRSDDFPAVCGGCQWFALCRATEAPR